MRFVVAGGGAAGLAAALAVARAGHEAVVLEGDLTPAAADPRAAFELERRGVSHYFQPHAFLPRGRRELAEWAPDVLETLIDAGADPQDIAAKLHGPREPADAELVYLWVRRPVFEWALRRAAAAEPSVDLRTGVGVTGLLRDQNGRGRAAGVTTDDGVAVRGDLVVDALGRCRPPAGWPRAVGEATDSGTMYYGRYFRLVEGVEHLDAPLLTPGGDLGYMGFNTIRGDNRTFAVLILTPTGDHELRVLRDEAAWERACAAITPLDHMTSPEYGRPITPVMPMGSLMNVDRTGEPDVGGLLAVGDAFCHTDPALGYGLSFALIHARALARAAGEAPDAAAVTERYRSDAAPESRERHRLACSIDAVRGRRWRGETRDSTRRDGSDPVLAFAGALAAAPHDDLVLRRTVRQMGLLDSPGVFDEDGLVKQRVDTILADSEPSASPGPPRDELLARIRAKG